MSLKAPTQADLRGFRAEAGLSQVRLAEILGVSRRAVEEWEAERSTPPAYLTFALTYLREHPLVMGQTDPGSEVIAEIIEDIQGRSGVDVRSPTVRLNLRVGPVEVKPGERLKKPKGAKT